MAGGSGPAILQYVRYHTNAEVANVLRTSRSHKSLKLSDDELRRILADIRVLAGTNPSMASGGYTGRRGGGAGGGRAGGAGGRGGPSEVATPAPGVGIGGNPTTTVKLADGRTLTGVMAFESDLDAALLSNGSYHLLSKEGEVYREKPIEPAQDWLTYDGSLTANRYSTLDQIAPARRSRGSLLPGCSRCRPHRASK